MSDTVNHPSHYNQGDIECIDAMREISSPAEFAGYCRLSTFKYLWRLYAKGRPLEDAQKAQWYLNELIKTLERNNNADETRTRRTAGHDRQKQRIY